MVALGGIANIGIYAVVTLLTPFIVDIMQLEAALLGILHSIWSSGYIVGSILMAKNIIRLPSRKILFFCLFAVGTINILMSQSTKEIVWLPYTLIFLWGIFIALFNITYSHLCIKNTDKEIMGRTSSLRILILQGAGAIGAFGGSALATSIGIQQTFVMAGLIPISAALIYFFFLSSIETLEKKPMGAVI